MEQVKREHPLIQIEEIEVLTNMARARRDGVRTLPTLIIGEKRFYRALHIDKLLAIGQISLNPEFSHQQRSKPAGTPVRESE